jgi:hypothetical protein
MCRHRKREKCLSGGIAVKIYKRVWLLPAGSLVMLALSPAYAFAIPPTVETVTLHRDLGVVGSCPGFEVTATFDPTRRITTFYNAEGTPIREQIHAEVPGTVTNAVTGKSLPTIGVRNITTDLLTGETKSTATNVHVVVPGQGTVQLAAGLFEIDGDGNLVKEVGRQDPPVTPALCAALA